MKVKFVPQNIEIEVTPDRTLLQYATENGIEIKSICKGVPSCAECRIRVIDGDSNVLPPTKPELELIGTNWRIDSRRLACQIRCYGDITVDMTEQIQRQENQTKKVRGYRSSKQSETQAVQDTMILTEKPEIRDEPVRQAPSEKGGDRGNDRQQGRQQKPKQQQQQKKQKQPQNQNQNQQARQQNQQPKQQGQGQGQNQQPKQQNPGQAQPSKPQNQGQGQRQAKQGGGGSAGGGQRPKPGGGPKPQNTGPKDRNANRGPGAGGEKPEKA